MRTPHTTVRRGKKVRIKLRNGTIIVDKFVERTGKYILLKDHVLKPVDIINLTIYKPSE